LKNLYFLLLVMFVIFSQKAHTQQLTLSGIVKDYHSQKPVPLATLKINKSTRELINGGYVNSQVDFKATAANEDGQFSVVIPAGEYVIEASAVGYIKKSKFLNFKKSTVFDIELSEQINQLEDVEVTTQKAENNVKSIEMSTIKVNLQTLKTSPIVFGEGDIIRALTLQTGVTNAGEGAGGFSVRGGRTDQNLVLLDDAPLFNTSHLLGLFTSVNSESIQNATLYKGGIPARYGGRLSSLLGMNTKVATNDKKTVVGVGPISSNALIQRNFADKKGSFMLAARGAYPTWLINAFPRRIQGSKAAFYDINGSLQYRFGANHSLTLTAYQSNDAFKFPEDTSYFWRSQIATAQWNSQLSSKLSWSVKGILSHYTYGVKGLGKGFEYEFMSRVRHHEVRTDFLFQAHEKHKLEWGANAIFYRFSPGNIQRTKETSAINPKTLPDEQGRELATYLSYDWTVSKRVSIQAGARYSMFQNLGPAQVFVYQPNQPITQETITDTLRYAKGQTNFDGGGFEPRFLFKYELNDRQSLKLSYNRTRQYLHLITNTTAISPVDFWKMANRYTPPQMADQFSVGYYRNLKDNTYVTYVEGFYKKMEHLVEYKDGASLLLNDHLETELLSANGYSYGAEVSLQKNKGRLTGFVNYTWSRAWVAALASFPSELVNQGKYYPSLFDKPHNINISGQWFMGAGWSISTNFVYQTGRPITYPDGKYTYNDALVYNYSSRNMSRLPDYHRLDLSLSRDGRRTKDQRRYSILNISFYNLYARRNPYSIFFKQYYGYSKSYRLSVLGTVIPSITLTTYW
jgi:CarboxypepD_reg-like domain/TonB-dependent Receptor Plug Domain